MATETDAGPHRPSVEEATLGWLHGVEEATLDRQHGVQDPRPTQSARQVSPRSALEAALLPALQDGTCFVAFSGGRDSSSVLAVAVDVARRHALREPIALTLRYPALPETDERRWQESVVRHIGVKDWEVLDLTCENGLTGPHAAELLRTGGPYFPFAAHTSMPLARLAAEGVVLTGEGGDLVLAPGRTWALSNVLERRGRVEPVAWRSVAEGLAPARRRAQRAGRAAAEARPWLTVEGRALARRAAAGEAREEPLGWAAALRRTAQLRALRRGLATLGRVYRFGGAEVKHPLLDAGFLVALGARYGFLGPLSRGRVVADLAGDLLPPDLSFRRDKSDFTRALVTRDVRAVVDEWDGLVGVDLNLVAADRLRIEWQKPRPSANSLQLLLEVVHAMRHAEATS